MEQKNSQKRVRSSIELQCESLELPKKQIITETDNEQQGKEKLFGIIPMEVSGKDIIIDFLPDNETKPAVKIITQKKRNAEREMHKTEGGIKGTSISLEKAYFRLSGAPDPSTVRPKEILKASLNSLKEKWSTRNADYEYICEQLRSIRQDMVIQHITDEFTAEVYETHARIALECRDISHFNQCQTQLAELYKAGIKGCNEEFLAYRMLYLCLHNMNIDLMLLFKDAIAHKNHEAILFTRRVIQALVNNDYIVLFREYKSATRITKCLIDLFIDRLRVFALQTISTAYMTGINLNYITEALAFESEKQCKEFIIKAGGAITKNRLDCKTSLRNFMNCAILNKKIM